MGISLWVSDANIAGIAAFLPGMFFFGKRSYLLSKRILWLGTGVLSILLLIGYCRYLVGLNGPNIEYFKIANIEEFIWGIKHFIWKWASNLAASSNPELAYSLTVIYFMLIHIIVLLGAYKGFFSNRPPLIVYLALFDIFYSVVILSAKHTYIGERKYERFFVPLNLNSIYLATAMFCESIRNSRFRKIFCLVK